MADQPNFQIPPLGFGSYLQDILPEDVAIAAGAFAASMQQIRNIKNVNFEEFAQVVSSIEVTTKNLDMINGTDVPTDTALADAGKNILALGSGPNGAFTASDMFGCMSGLPYSWRELQNNIEALQTTKLSNIYNQLYLATTWDSAVITVQYTTNAGPTYTVTGVTISIPGGGYGRGGAAAPTITIAGGSGATATCTIGTDPSDAGSTGSGTFGRVTTVTLTSAGITTGTIPTATIQCPPTATLPVAIDGSISTSGVNTASGTAGWPGMNTVVTDYVAQANAEIQSIVANNPTQAKICNTVYNAAGKQLMIEQRTRYNGIAPVPPELDTYINQYLGTVITFTDALGNLAKNTYPHMYAQTLEAIADLSTTGGQSIVGLMRQERNAARLSEIGIELDTEIPGNIGENTCPVLISNNTVPTAEAGIDVTGINGNSEDPVTTYTVPSILLQQTDELIAPKPYGYYDPNTNEYIKVGNTTNIEQSPPIQGILNVENTATNNTNLLGPYNNGTGPAIPVSLVASTNAAELQSGLTDTAIGGSTATQTQPIAVVTVGARVPTGQGVPLDVGKAEFLGSLAGSPATNLIPCTLNSAYTSSVLLPNQLSVQEAIDEVIKCNCTCWVD
jgi:hypothetical protein